MLKILSLVFLAVSFLPRIVASQYASVNDVLLLTGNGYVSIPYSRAFNGDLNKDERISIDAWVYPTSFTGAPTIVGNDWTAGYWLGLNTAGKVRFYPWPGGYYESNGTVPLNQWTHVAVAFDARLNSLLFFINGILDRTVTTSQGYVGSVSSGDLRIGADRQSGVPAYYWNGRIDEVRIWNDQINFATALGALYRIPHAVYNGRYGRDLVAGWRLNTSANGINNQFNGSPVGTVAYASSPVPPHYNRICAVFTNSPGATAPGSDDFFSVSSSPGNSLVQNYTLECWVKPASANGSTTYQTFISKSSPYSGTWTYWFGMNKANNRLRFVPTGVFSNFLESATAIPIGQWTHVAARYQVAGGTRTATVFINGQSAGSKSYATDAAPNQTPLMIGRTETSAAPIDGYGFSGSLDEVRIWNAARSNDEILNTYRMELSGPLPNLTGSYHFDGDVLDFSGAGNHGSHLLAFNSDVYFNDASDLPAQPSILVVQPNGGESWAIGSNRVIQWTSTGLQNLRIELSRDGGQTFPEVLTASTPAVPGMFNWTVSGPTTSMARVRITTTTPTTLADISDKDFTIAQPPPVLSVTPASLVFSATDNGPLPPPQKVYLTNTGGGTLQWNISNNQPWLSMTPASGFANSDSFEVAIMSTGLGEGTYRDSIEVGGNASNAGLKIPVSYRIVKKPIYTVGGVVMYGGTPVGDVTILFLGDENLTVKTDKFGKYAASIPQGNYIVAPSHPFYEFTPPSRSYEPLMGNVSDADFTAQDKRGRVLFRYKQGWNLCSLPLIPDMNSLTALFPDAVPPAYFYEQSEGYKGTLLLEFGRGYWIRFSRTDSLELTGVLKPSVDVNVSSSFGGWNLIGVPSSVANIPAIMQTPVGILRTLYEYDPFIGYFLPLGGVLRPGRGYFAKVSEDGTLRISAWLPFTTWIPLPSLRYPGAVVLDLPPPPPPTTY